MVPKSSIDVWDADGEVAFDLIQGWCMITGSMLRGWTGVESSFFVFGFNSKC